MSMPGHSGPMEEEFEERKVLSSIQATDQECRTQTDRISQQNHLERERVYSLKGNPTVENIGSGYLRN